MINAESDKNESVVRLNNIGKDLSFTEVKWQE